MMFCSIHYQNKIFKVNQCKNRFPYCLPPDFNRITLCPIREVEGSNYINASWVDGFKSRKSYIAA